MIEHYVDCEVCGTIVSMKDAHGLTRDPNGNAYVFREVVLDITTTHEGKTYPTRMLVSFCGPKMVGILSRFEVGDVVCVRFTPKCKATEGKYGTKYYSYNLAFRISLAEEYSEYQ